VECSVTILDARLGDFFYPYVVQRGPANFAIQPPGKAPPRPAPQKSNWKGNSDPEYEEWLAQLGKLADKLRTIIWIAEERRGPSRTRSVEAFEPSAKSRPPDETFRLSSPSILISPISHLFSSIFFDLWNSYFAPSRTTGV